MNSKNNELMLKMTEYYRGDPKRIQHFIKVHAFAKAIGEAEELDEKALFILECAALVHDIGIKPAEEQYGKGVCGGDLQQRLGPAPAREMLKSLELDENDIERICFLVAHHHTYSGVNSIDWQILLEADFLVNAYEDSLSKTAICSFRDKVFKTKSGLTLLNAMFDLEE
ncbi:MAG: HD domain-containing protein [Ruminococcus sp.]|nr:HD domain-containing protein [Ruminococcus sp.]